MATQQDIPIIGTDLWDHKIYKFSINALNNGSDFADIILKYKDVGGKP